MDGEDTSRYEGFNLLHWMVDDLHYHNNVQPHSIPLSPGIHGLSNAFLNCALAQGGTRHGHAARADGDRREMNWWRGSSRCSHDRPAPDGRLGNGPADRHGAGGLESFIDAPGCGTRCSTVVLVETGRESIRF